MCQMSGRVSSAGHFDNLRKQSINNGKRLVSFSSQLNDMCHCLARIPLVILSPVLSTFTVMVDVYEIERN